MQVCILRVLQQCPDKCLSLWRRRDGREVSVSRVKSRVMSFRLWTLQFAFPAPQSPFLVIQSSPWDPWIIKHPSPRQCCTWAQRTQCYLVMCLVSSEDSLCCQGAKDLVSLLPFPRGLAQGTGI